MAATWVERTTWSDGRRCTRASRGRGEGRSSPSRTMPPSAGSARWNRARRRCPSPLRRPPPTGASARAPGARRRPWTRRRRRRRRLRRARTTTRLLLLPMSSSRRRRTRPLRATSSPDEGARTRLNSPRRRRRRSARLCASPCATPSGARARRTRTCDGSRRPPSSRPRSRGRGRWRWALGRTRTARTTAEDPPIRGSDRPTADRRSPTARAAKDETHGRDVDARPPHPRLTPGPVAHVGAARRLPHVPAHAYPARARAAPRIKNVPTRRPLRRRGTGAAPVPRARRATRARRVRRHGPARDGARGEGVGVKGRGAARGPKDGRRAEVRDAGGFARRRPGLGARVFARRGCGKVERTLGRTRASSAGVVAGERPPRGGSRDKPGGSSSRGVKGGVDTPNSGPSRRGSASNLSAFSGDSGGTRPHPTEAPIPPALLAACGRGVRLGEFVSSLNPPLATVLASDAPFPYTRTTRRTRFANEKGRTRRSPRGRWRAWWRTRRGGWTARGTFQSQYARGTVTTTRLGT